MSRLLLRVTLAVVLASVSLDAALAAGNTVSGGRVGSPSLAITANTLKPASCSGITLTATLTGSGIFSGTAANELILGSTSADTIDGGAGNDCILGGGGVDTLLGGAGTDVCIGGPGTEILALFVGCETTIQ